MEQKREIYRVCPFERVFSRFFSSEPGRQLLNAKKEILLSVKSVIERELEKTEGMKGEVKAEKVEIK